VVDDPPVVIEEHPIALAPETTAEVPNVIDELREERLGFIVVTGRIPVSLTEWSSRVYLFSLKAVLQTPPRL
jgi:ABC-type arginine transport system ATPase subunit